MLNKDQMRKEISDADTLNSRISNKICANVLYEDWCIHNHKLPKLLLNSIVRSSFMCNAFMIDELWNCTFDKSTLHWKSIDNPENAFLTSLTIASTLLTFIEEHSKGELADLTLEEGKKFIRNFMDIYVSKRSRVSREMVEEKNKISKVNAKVGIKTLEESRSESCKCHGISGSCSVSTCWKTDNFRRAVSSLKQKYRELKNDSLNLCHGMEKQWDVTTNEIPTEKVFIVENKRQLQCTEKSIYYPEYCGIKFETRDRICFTDRLKSVFNQDNVMVEDTMLNGHEICEKVCCGKKTRREEKIEAYDCPRASLRDENRICYRSYYVYYCT